MLYGEDPGKEYESANFSIIYAEVVMEARPTSFMPGQPMFILPSRFWDQAWIFVEWNYPSQDSRAGPGAHLGDRREYSYPLWEQSDDFRDRMNPKLN